MIEQIRTHLEPLRRGLLSHPLYKCIGDIDDLRRFMEFHVFAVWDFMSLLKSLQRRLSCVDLPWTPPADAESCRLVNEIVLGEESDEDGRGGYASHFDLYRRAMRECGASTGQIDRFVELVGNQASVESAFESVDAPIPVRQFVGQTFAVIETGEVGAIAAAFTFGREDLLPDVFRRIVQELDETTHGSLTTFGYYLERHIEVDGGEHGPMAWRLMERLCGESPVRWRVAQDTAVGSLIARKSLWDGIRDRLAAGSQPVAARTPFR